MASPVSNSSPNRVHRLLLTGAAGGLGKVLRERLQPLADVIRLSDVADMAPAPTEHPENDGTESDDDGGTKGADDGSNVVSIDFGRKK